VSGMTGSTSNINVNLNMSGSGFNPGMSVTYNTPSYSTYSTSPGINYSPLSSTLGNARGLFQNQEIRSPNGRYKAVMQGDGNFVLYENETRAVWASNTNGRGAIRCEMQNDGNLVLYDSGSRPVWASNTCGKGRAPFRLEMQNDRNLVVYDSFNSPTWATGTNI